MTGERDSDDTGKVLRLQSQLKGENKSFDDVLSISSKAFDALPTGRVKINSNLK